MATSYLTQTLGSGPTLGTKCTVSFWVKRSGLSAWDNGGVLGGYSNASGTNTDNFQIGFNGSDQFYCWGQSGSSTEYNLESNRLARDTSAWYHVCWILDSTEGSSSDRVKLYVNGVQETSWASNSYPSSSFAFPITKNGNLRTFGRYTNTSGNQYYMNGSVSNLIIVDGSALPATTFGEVDSTSGIWKYKAASGVTFGTNGCWLKGENSANLGLDSGASNNFSSGGGTPTQSIDTPSNNYITMNTLDNQNQGSTFTIANTKIQWNTNNKTNFSWLSMNKGKWYWEIKYANNTGGTDAMIGIVRDPRDPSDWPGHDNNGFSYYASNGNKYYNGSGSSYGDSWTTNDIISVAYNADTRTIWFAKNGVWQNSATESEIEAGTTTNAAWTGIGSAPNEWYCAMSGYNGNKAEFNFGAGYFSTTPVSTAGDSSTGDDSVWEYDCPNGFYGLNTKNINTYG